MLTGKKQKHGENGSLHFPVVGGAFQGLPGTRLPSPAASHLKGVSHQFGGLHLTQTGVDTSGPELLATGYRHVESGDGAHGHYAAMDGRLVSTDFA